MLFALVLWSSQLLADKALVEVKFAQVAPLLRETAPFEKSPDQARAVVLVHGLQPHPFSRRNASCAKWYGWQRPGSTVVESLREDSDVFALAYSQNVAVERIAATATFRDSIALLKKMGYREIVLVGHSAGGLVARHFVEDYPKAGVTKVVQICTPNGGSSWGRARFGVREPQEVFLSSLSKRARKKLLKERADETIPKNVEFVCLVGQVNIPENLSLSIKLGEQQAKVVIDLSDLRGDGLVSAASQWPADLQKQGIPALLLPTSHFTVMHSRTAAARIAELVREPQPRWDESEVAEAKRRVLGTEE